MKVVTIPQLESILYNIVHDAEETAKLKREVFNGISDDELFPQLTKRIGDGWVLKKNTFKFTEADIMWVAGNRFFHETGIKLLALLMCIIVALRAVTDIFPIIPLYLYQILVGISAVAIFYFYITKLKKARKELIIATGHRVELPR